MHGSCKGRALGSVTAAGVLAASLAAVPTVASAAPGVSAASPSRAAGAQARVTDFGFSASAYGSRLRGGDVIPADSGRTAWAYLGCTRLAGKEKTNRLLGISPGRSGGTEVETAGSRTKVWTTKKNGVVASRARSSVARVSIKNPGVGSLRLTGLVTNTRTWHDQDGFHQRRTAGFLTATAQVGGISVDIPDNPSRGQTVEVRGVADIKFFAGRGRANGGQASATIDAVRITLADSGRLTVARAHSRIDSGLVAGVLGGRGIAVEGTLLGGTVKTGRIANQPVGCRGTKGDLKRNALTAVELERDLSLGGLVGSARADQISSRRAYVKTRGKVARLSVGRGDLVVRGVVGAANVRKRGAKLVRNARGTTIASISAGGDPVRVPGPGGTVRIPGVGKLTYKVVDRSKRAIDVTAVKLVLFNQGLGKSIILLGQASAKIKPR